MQLAVLGELIFDGTHCNFEMIQRQYNICHQKEEKKRQEEEKWVSLFIFYAYARQTFVSYPTTGVTRQVHLLYCRESVNV